MAPDSLRFFENAPDAPKKDADVSPKVDLSEFERRYRSLKDMAARGELKDTLGTILATRDAGQCLRTGQWYVESVRDGVWLSPIGTESLGASRPKTFVSYFELEHSIDDLLTSLAVPSNGLDAFKEKKPELSEAEKQSVRRELTYLDRQIDLAGSRGENTLQSALIDFRVGFAESEALWAPTSTAEALRTANADLARVLAPDYRAGAKDYWDLSVDFINLLRYGTSQASAEMFARIKDNTSRKLFELWPNEAPVEKAFRETLDPYGENANVVVLRFVENLKAAPAMGAGVIDGILDTTQSGIDLAIVPEKVVAGVRDFVKSVPQEEWKQALDELSWAAQYPDVAYCLAYVATVFRLGWRLWPEIWAMTIPHLLDRLVTSGAISRDVAPKMSHALSRLSPSLTRLVEENNAAVRLAKEASGKAIPKTDDVSTSLTRMSLANQEIARARGIFEQANSAAVVANTFVEKVRTRIAPNMTPEENAKLALDLFLDSFTNGKEKTLADLQAAKKDAPKHAIYWIERTEAKFGELERVFEEEIIPLDMELKRLQKNKDVKWMLALQNAMQLSFQRANSLTKTIVNRLFEEFGAAN